MLVLSRKRGEVVRVEIGGETLAIRIVSLGENRVRLGFDGAKSVKVVRQELLPAEPAAADAA